MKGLEVSILTLSHVIVDNRDKRLDSQYYRRAALTADALITTHAPDRLSEISKDVRSFGAYALTNEFEYQEEGIPFLRGTDYSGDFINFDNTLKISDDAHRLLHKSEVTPGMVLLSMSGSVGSVAVALDEWDYPINSNQDIAKIIPDGVSPYYLAAYLGCRFGQVQINRLPVGSVQQHIFLWMIERLKVPRFSSEFERRVEQLTAAAYRCHEGIGRDHASAENALLVALGLIDWTPPKPLTYSALASDALAAKRLDARFFQPRIRALLNMLSKDNRTVAEVARQRRAKFRPDDCVNFDYIEISDIDGFGAATSTRLACKEAPSRATWHVRPNDIITSSVRPIRRLTAQIAPEQDGFVCSSGFVVVEPLTIAPELMLTYLRLPIICELLDLYASASMYPAITDTDILNLPLPLISDAVSNDVVRSVRSAKEAKAKAIALLDAAKRAVEVAIEDGEMAALRFLAEAEETV